jgi:uncharacterized protein YjbI with pentapeptide repeats
MTRDEALELLRGGRIGDFNQRRQVEERSPIDLSHVDLANAALEGVDLGRCDLRGADLSNAKMRHANLSDVLATNLNMSGTDLRESCCRSADLQKSQLDRANFKLSDLTRADLADSSLGEARLKYANLSGAKLYRASLVKANLTNSKAGGAKLTNSNMRGASLSGADLVSAELDHADGVEADLTGALLRAADLEGTDLTRSDLAGADLEGAALSGTTLVDADLSYSSFHGAIIGDLDLAGARMSRTLIVGVDLSSARGLSRVNHAGPSTIGEDTLRLSKGRIPKAFLKGAGLPDWQIEASRLYDPDLSNAQIADIQNRVFELRSTGLIAIGGVFLSYNRDDSLFVDKLEEHLDEAGARTWRDVHDMVAGPMERQVVSAIGTNDAVVVVLSESSVNSDWVAYEVERGRERERSENRDILCPIAIDDAWESLSGPMWSQLRRDKNILDFSKWKTKKFDEQFDKLVKGLKVFYSRPDDDATIT